MRSACQCTKGRWSSWCSCRRAPVSPVTPSNGDPRHRHSERALDPQPRIRRGRSLLERRQEEIDMDFGYPAAGFAAEYDTGRPETELGQVHPEDVGIIVVIRMERKALVHGGYRVEPSKHETATTEEHLGSGADR